MTLFIDPENPIKVKRSTGGGYDSHGIWQDGPTTLLDVEGSIQPMSARDVLVLDPEDREEGLVVVFTDAVLLTASRGSTTDGDILVWQGLEYRVMHRDPFSNGIIPHNRYRAKLVGKAT